MVKYTFRGEISQLSLDVVSRIGSKMLELFPPKRTDNPQSIIECSEYNLCPKKLEVELSHGGDEPNREGKTYFEIPCAFGVDLDRKKAVPYQENKTNGFRKIKPYLDKIILELTD